MMRPKAKIAPEHQPPPIKGPPGRPPPRELVSAAKATIGQKKAPPPAPKPATGKIVPIVEAPSLAIEPPILTPRTMYLQHAQETLTKANGNGESATNLINQLLHVRVAHPPPSMQRSQEEERKRQEEELRRLTQSYEETNQKHDELMKFQQDKQKQALQKKLQQRNVLRQQQLQQQQQQQQLQQMQAMMGISGEDEGSSAPMPQLARQLSVTKMGDPAMAVPPVSSSSLLPPKASPRALPLSDGSIPEEDAEEGGGGAGGMSKRELLAALAALRKQNEEVVRNLTQEKQSLTNKLTEAQEKSEQKLIEERAAYEKKMEQIAAEKEANAKEFERLQEEFRQSSMTLESKSADLEAKLASLQSEREKMVEEVDRLEQAKKEAESKGIFAQQDNERLLQLQEEIKRMDDQKSKMISELEANSALINEQSEQLQEQLKADRDAYHANLQHIEQEKQDLLNRLLAAENVALLHQQALEKQRREEEERERLKQEEIQRRHAQASTSVRSLANSSFYVSKFTLKLKKKRAIARQAVKARVKNVLSKMKALNVVEAMTKTESALKPSTRSLFEAVNTTMITNTLRSKAQRGTAGDATDTVADETDDCYHILGEEDFNPVLLEEELDGNATVSSLKASKFQPELPPVHLAAAHGDLERLKHLVSEEERIFTAKDSVRRLPLFYAVVHGNQPIVEYLVGLHLEDKEWFNCAARSNHFQQDISPEDDAFSLVPPNDPQYTHDPISKAYFSIYTSSIYNALSHQDLYGDTAIHAASAAGGETILEFLLGTMSQAVQEIVYNTYAYDCDCDTALNTSVPVPAEGEAPVDSTATEGVEVVPSSAADAKVIYYAPYSDTGYNTLYTYVMAHVVNIGNGLGMSASHLAMDQSILHILHYYYANLLTMDKRNRSILFLCAAMNKTSCVEYLVNSLDNLAEMVWSAEMLGAESEDLSGGIESFIMKHMMQGDYRGDTPVHAAACNNAIDALLTLLQSGIDPRPLDAGNFAPYDLALKNKNDACVKILAEYTLYYCTGSEFDSVLFWKTLEGQRHIYDSIKEQQQNAANGIDNHASLPSAETMQVFSMKDHNTLSMQKYGEWIGYYDSSAPKTIFWYNAATMESSWVAPAEVVTMVEQRQKENEQYDQMMQSNDVTMKLQREGDWIIYKTEDNRTFYYNDKVNKFQWNSPFEEEPSTERKEEVEVVNEDTVLLNETEAEQAYNQEDAVQDYSAAMDQVLSNQVDLPDYVLASDWRPYLDQDSGVTYWYNCKTEESQWDSPFDGISQPSEAGAVVEGNVEAAKEGAPEEAVPVAAEEEATEEQKEAAQLPTETEVVPEESAESKEAAASEVVKPAEEPSESKLEASSESVPAPAPANTE